MMKFVRSSSVPMKKALIFSSSVNSSSSSFMAMRRMMAAQSVANAWSSKSTLSETPYSTTTMQIFVKAGTPQNKNTTTATTTITALDVQSSDSIASVQDRIYALGLGPSPEQQHLVCNNRAHGIGIHNHSGDVLPLFRPASTITNPTPLTTLADWGIDHGSTLHVHMRLMGGHCQVPCGIFDDPAMVAELKEASATLRKSIVQATDLHASAHLNLLSMNQLFRWIQTKEQHADKIIDKVSTYGLCQRVKKEIFQSDDEYVEALKAHHAVMQCAMKCKQSATVDACDALDAALTDMAPMYLPK